MDFLRGNFLVSLAATPDAFWSQWAEHITAIVIASLTTLGGVLVAVIARSSRKPEAASDADISAERKTWPVETE